VGGKTGEPREGAAENVDEWREAEERGEGIRRMWGKRQNGQLLRAPSALSLHIAD
jgi:hypothetical protein